MHYKVDPKNLTISQVFSDEEFKALLADPLTNELAARVIVHEFENLTELIAFLCPPEWGKREYKELRLTRLALTPHSESMWLTADEYAIIYKTTREYVYQLAQSGRIKSRTRKGKKFFRPIQNPL